MTYQQVFGGTVIYPSDVSYLAITLSDDKALEWPLESNDPANPAARIIDVTAAVASKSITLPNATQTGAGQTILFNNLPASTQSFTVKDYAGNTLATVGVGEQWQVYLASVSTAAGTWRVFRYGASTATVQASALAGYGLTVTGGTLSQSVPVTTFNATPRTLLTTDRASAFIWDGTGTGTLNLLGAAVAGNNFFISVRNAGGGDLVIDPAGSELIDGATTLALRPGDSAEIITDGLAWYTIGLGQQAIFAFDYTSISVTGGTYTLAGSELNRIAYKFVGTLASDQYIVVPPTIQQYWVDNATTGAYAFYLQTSGGTPVAVTQGSRGIYYCNGVNVVDADTATLSVPISAADGGTGQTSYTIGDLLYASGSTTLSRLADVAVNNVLLSGGVGVAPAYGKVGLTTHVSGTLPVASGGTGGTDAATARSNLSAAKSGANSDITSLTGLTTPLSVAQGGTGAVTLTGIIKGAGTAALAAATAGTDYVAPGTATNFTALQTFTGTSSTLAAKLLNALEKVTLSATAATGTINYDVTTQSILYYTSNASGNWTMNFRASSGTSLDSAMATGESVTIVFLATQGGTAYYNSAVQVDGTTVGVTTKWLGAAPAAGTVSGVDIYSYTIVKTGAATFTVFASKSGFV